MKFRTPIGLAAGFDKNGVAIEGMAKMGFSFIEIGSVTPKPQPGNPKPRVFRLPKDEAVINCYGFNSDGHDTVHENISKLSKKENRHYILGINLGKNKTAKYPIQDYIDGINKFGTLSDYLVINVSSPNTPGLRDMQHADELRKLIMGVRNAQNNLANKPPLLIKLAPDLDAEHKQQIADIVIDPKYKIDGLIVSNTTITRPKDLVSLEDLKSKPGGLSGKPLNKLSTATIRDMAVLTQGKIPIIGVGGISSGEDAYEKIRNGASLVQLYTALIYGGPKLVQQITTKLEELLRKDGFNNVEEAVGADIKSLIKK